MVKKQYKGKIRINERIEALISPLEKEQFQGLEDSLLAEGRAYNPLWLWGDLLVDGHHRYKLCKKHKLPFDVIQVYETAETLEDVEYRVMRDAISQRNLPPGLQSKYRAEMVKYQISLGKNKKEAVLQVAKDTEVSERQVYRDVAKAELIEKVDESVKDVAAELPSKALKQLVELPKKQQKAVAKKSGGDSKALKKEIVKSKGKEKPSAAKIFSMMQRQHFSGASGLPQMIDSMAEANGGKGGQYDIANASLDSFLGAARSMREGNR